MNEIYTQFFDIGEDSIGNIYEVLQAVSPWASKSIIDGVERIGLSLRV